MSLQYISDTTGNRTAVVIPIEEWDQLKEKYPEMESLEEDIPAWQKELVRSRRKLINQPGQLIPVDDFLREMEQEADEEI
jgi:PHD/YefM family antitoxin component YafN of YafNO toxin-antitoxin module